MITFGSPPFLECSSRGDGRFSAFYAVVDGRSIEERYQAAKVFETSNGRRLTGLSVQQAKGLRPVNEEQVRRLYRRLWRRYIAEHPELLDVLKRASGLSDVFGQEGHACQAEELWLIRKKAIL